MGTSAGVVSSANIDTSNYNSTILLVSNNVAKRNMYYRERVIFSLYQTPDWAQTESSNYFLVSLPTFNYMSEQLMDENHYKVLMIRMHDPSNHDLIDKIGKALDKALPGGIQIHLTYKQVSSSGSITEIVNYIFYLTIAVMMFLCFFSLTASMSANLFEASKEIGILRAMGVTKGRIRMLYFYEALLLVNASCLLGIFIGTLVGYTMAL